MTTRGERLLQRLEERNREEPEPVEKAESPWAPGGNKKPVKTTPLEDAKAVTEEAKKEVKHSRASVITAANHVIQMKADAFRKEQPHLSAAQAYAHVLSNDETCIRAYADAYGRKGNATTASTRRDEK